MKCLLQNRDGGLEPLSVKGRERTCMVKAEKGVSGRAQREDAVLWHGEGDGVAILFTSTDNHIVT